MTRATPAPGPAKKAVLIAALSGRALSEAAARAGYLPLVADFFGDADMRRSAFASRKVKGSLSEGLDPNDLACKLEELAGLSHSEPVGLVYGGTFERDDGGLERFAGRWRILGTSPDVVRRVKEPATLKAALDSLEIPSPAIRLGVPASKDGWLVKRRGGSGGGHIRPWDGKPPDNSRGAVYFQERVAGIPISALFIGAEGRAILVGFSRQWESASPAYPFRFGGACHLGKEELCPRLLRDMIRRTAPLFQAFPMTGLVSLDFLVDGARWNLLEINPRPGATLDIFDIEGTNLFEHHVKAASGILPETPFHFVKAAAAEIVYADEGALELKPEVTLPDWIKDQPDPDASIERNDPICTVFAMAGDANAALNLCKERVRYARNFFRKASFMGECRDDGRWQSFQSS